MKTNQSPKEYSTTTETSPSLQPRVVSTGTVAGNVISKLVMPSELRKTGKNFVDIDELVAREEATPEGKAGIEQARNELSAELEATYGRSLKSYRLARGISQAKLGEIIGTSQAHIARLESSSDMQLSTMLRLAKALGIDPHSALDAILVSVSSEE